MFDLQTQFFKPLWIRITVVAVCVLWSIVEFSNQSILWGAIFAGLGVVAFHQFFLTDWPESSNSNGENAPRNNASNGDTPE